MGKIIIDYTELQRRLSLPLEEKIKWSIERYIDFVEVYQTEGVYVGFSGGKDSQTIASIITKLHNGDFEYLLENEYLFLYNKMIKGKSIPELVFCDTGLEFPEIRSHVKKFPATWLKPKKNWVEVVKEEGFLIGSKKVSRMLSDIRNPTDGNLQSRTLYLSGIKSDGTKSKSFKLPQKYKILIDAPFGISGKCCDYFKKMPFKAFEKETKKKPITATSVEESDMRRISYMQTGCNTFSGNIISRPMSIWKESDVWEYHDKYNLRFSEVYYNREVEYKDITGEQVKESVEGEKRTGCMFCLVGDKKAIESRMQRLNKTHQKQFDFLMGEKIGMNKVLDYLGVKVVDSKQLELFKKH